MQQLGTTRRMTARTAAAVLLAVVGMLALGGAWTSATATPGNSSGNGQSDEHRPGDGEVGPPAHANKPPTQNNGNDNNKGHECDGNKGIGQGNPAHPGCGGTTNTPTTLGGSNCVTNCNPGTTGGTPSVTPQTPTGEAPSAEVLGLTEERPAAEAAAPVAGAAPASALAFTGVTSDVIGFLGIALLAFGMAFILVARKPEGLSAA
jgi:hypothetical protein